MQPASTTWSSSSSSSAWATRKLQQFEAPFDCWRRSVTSLAGPRDVAKPAPTCCGRAAGGTSSPKHAAQQEAAQVVLPAGSTQRCCQRRTGAGTQVHLSGQRPHDCEGGHVQRHPRASRQLGLVDLVAATDDIAGPTAGLDDDCRQAGCVSRHPDPELQAPMRWLCSGSTCSRLPASRGSLASAGCAAGSICAAACRQTGYRRQQA